MAIGGRKSQKQAHCGKRWEDGGFWRTESTENTEINTFCLPEFIEKMKAGRGTMAHLSYARAPRATFLWSLAMEEINENMDSTIINHQQ